MTSPIDNKTILQGSHPERAAYLRAQLQEKGWKQVSDHLLESVGSGALPGTIFHIWLSVSKDPEAVAALLRQDVSLTGRHVAMRRFGKAIKSEEGFSAVWLAVGGVEGIVNLMATFSVQEIKVLCQSVAFASRAAGPVKQRQETAAELYRALCGTGSVPNPDTRPLTLIYKHLVPACTADIALASTKDDGKNQPPPRKLVEVHSAAFERDAWEQLFPVDGKIKKSVNHYKTVLSQNREFAFRVLQRIATDPAALGANKDVLLEDLVNPLLERLHRLRHKRNTQLTLDVVVQCVERERRVVMRMDWTSGPLYYAAKLWNRSKERQEAEATLKSLVAAMPAHPAYTVFQIHPLLKCVKLRLRYPLLRLVLMNAKWFGHDIDVVDDETNKKIKERAVQWPVNLFTDLPAPEALALCRRLMAVYPAGDFIAPNGTGSRRRRWNTLYSEERRVIFTKVVSEHHVDPEILCTFLESLVSEDLSLESMWLARAKKQIAERKTKAMNTRDWAPRSDWIVSALHLAVATGSLDIYTSVLQWTRRFLRDPQTLKKIYSEESIFTEEGLNLLASVPSGKATGSLAALEDVETAVRKGNKTILHFLETAGEAIKEPSFQSSNWDNVLRLTSEAIRRRVSFCEALQKNQSVSAKDVWATILEPSIDLVLEAERFGLKEENESLNFCWVDGPLRDWTDVTPTEPMCQFLDKLAEKRDELWAEYRIKVHPATTTLQKPWPRGLAIQDLCPSLKLEKLGLTGLSYLQSRAEALTFIDASALAPQPSDEEVKAAIGPFVDHYKFALDIYISSSTNEDDRDLRIQRAWEHATIVLTADRMTDSEATQYWGDVFCQSVSGTIRSDLERLKLVPPPLDLSEDVLSQLPEQDNGPTEWDPYPEHLSVKTESRQLPQTCLDCLLSLNWSFHGGRRAVETPFTEADSFVPPCTPPTIWDIQNQGQMNDSLAAAAIAFIDSICGSDRSLFLQPFPPGHNVRFPAFYLDQEFLERTRKSTRFMGAPLGIVERAAVNVPAQLLARLADSLLARLEKDPLVKPETRELAVKVIKLLIRSDRPELASRFVQQFILDKQDDSSWHRHLFNLGFLRRISANNAKKFLGALNSEIVRRLETQAQELAKKRMKAEETRTQKDTPASPGITDPSGVPVQEPSKKAELGRASFMKVSTIKMVAQVLNNADYVDQTFACSILVDLMNASGHPDIRIAVIQSLISTLRTTEDATLSDFIYMILENHVLPIASSINERNPPGEELWVAAERGDGPLPEVYVDSPPTALPPIMSLLTKSIQYWNKDTPEYERWVSRIIIPLSEKSAANNSRWVALFAKRHGFDIPQGYLPRLPLRTSVLFDNWGKYPQALTKSNFETIKSYALAINQPHESLLAANKAVNDNADLLQSDAGKHWLYLWYHNGPRAFNYGVNQIISTLQTTAPNTVHEVSVEEMQLFLRNMFHYFIDRGMIDHFQPLIIRLHPVGQHKDIWKTNSLPILEGLIKKVNELRTDAWQHDRQRHPAVLPSTFNIKVQIMQQKHSYSHSDKPSQDQISAFAAEIESLMNEIVESEVPYHAQWVSLVREVQQAVHNKHYLGLAVSLSKRLPQGDEQFRLADYLRSELINTLMAKADRNSNDDGFDDLAIVARALLDGWVDSPIEKVRENARATVQSLENRKVSSAWYSREVL